MAIKRLRSSTLAINKYNPSITQPIGSAYWLMIGVPNRVVSATRIKEYDVGLNAMKANFHINAATPTLESFIRKNTVFYFQDEKGYCKRQVHLWETFLETDKNRWKPVETFFHSFFHAQSLTTFWIAVDKQLPVDIVIRMKDDVNQHFPGAFLWQQDGGWANTISNHKDEQDGQEIHHVNELKDRLEKWEGLNYYNKARRSWDNIKQ